MRKCNRCDNQVEQERIDLLNSVICSSCAKKANTKPVRGIMVYGHKTAGTIQVVSQENFADYRRLAPYGKNTGRGSGIHRVTKTTSCM